MTVRKHLALFVPIVLASMACSALAQEESAAQRLADLPQVVEGFMSDWKVPGLALVVVKDGEIVMMRGFGHRDAEGGDPVTPKTLFAIGSATKAFTVMAMGMLVEQGQLDWDKPVIDYLPEFRMSDSYVTTHMTPRDLACHRSGLPRHDFVWYGADTSRAELLESLRYLEPSSGFRDTWQYQNLMFFTAGYMVGRLSGGTWEEFVAENIFQPLGMSASNFSVNDSQKTDDFALPYRERDDVVERVPFRNIDAIGPAGSINSNVDDMSKWLLLHLGEGKIGEKQAVSASTLREMHTPQMIIRGYPESDEVALNAYGLGWFITAYRGQYVVHHGGGIDGFTALVSLIPRRGIGLVVLTNLNANPLPAIVQYAVYDRLLGLEPVDWNARLRERIENAEEAQQKAAEGEKRVEGTSPSHPLADYVGAYSHPAYGEINVEAAGEGLKATLHGLGGPLEHFHYDVFKVRSDDLENPKITFLLNLDGSVGRISADLQPGVSPIVFERRAAEELKDTAYLEKFTGEFELTGQALRIELRGETLVAIAQGQPDYELEPVRENVFKIKSLGPDFSLEFTADESGEIVGLLLIQPQGSYKATKVK